MPTFSAVLRMATFRPMGRRCQVGIVAPRLLAGVAGAIGAWARGLRIRLALRAGVRLALATLTGLRFAVAGLVA